MASSRDIEVEEYEEIVGHPDSSPVLRRSSSAESVNVSPCQEPIMKVEEEFELTSRPTLRHTKPELAQQTQVPCKVRVATLSPERGARTCERQSLDRYGVGMSDSTPTSYHGYAQLKSTRNTELVATTERDRPRSAAVGWMSAITERLDAL